MLDDLTRGLAFALVAYPRDRLGFETKSTKQHQEEKDAVRRELLGVLGQKLQSQLPHVSARPFHRSHGVLERAEAPAPLARSKNRAP